MILIKGANVVFESHIQKSDVLVVGSTIKEIAKDISCDAQIINANGLYLFAGLIDMHTHLREPGFEYKEDIESGLKAAVAGGFTQIAAMPNTKPVCDNAAVASYICERAKQVNLAKLHPIGAVSVNQNGKLLAEIGKMKDCGIVAISDDGLPVTNSSLMQSAIKYASGFNLKVLSHCEDKSLSSGGLINEGFVSTITGLKGIPRAAEEIMVARDIILAQTLNLPVHLCHISTKGSVELVRQAKAQNVKVTAETCPHYFSLTDEAALSMSTYAKVNPPLREKEDRLEIIKGLKDGTIDAIASDHAPHHEDEKHCEFALAAFGISGLETSFALAITYLYKTGELDLPQISKLMSKSPSQILNLTGGEIKVGKTCDLMLADLDNSYKIERANFKSKGKNTPFENFEVFGKVKLTMVDGQIKFREGV